MISWAYFYIIHVKYRQFYICQDNESAKKGVAISITIKKKKELLAIM